MKPHCIRPITFTSEFVPSPLFVADPRVEDSSFDDKESILKRQFREITAGELGELSPKEYYLASDETLFVLQVPGNLPNEIKESRGYYKFIPDKINIETLLEIYQDLKLKLKIVPQKVMEATRVDFAVQKSFRQNLSETARSLSFLV